MIRERFGKILLGQGVITEEQLIEALARQKESKNLRLGALLVKLGNISDVTVAHALAKQFSLDYNDPLEEKVDKDLLALVPRQQAIKSKILPLRRIASGKVQVAMVDPQDLSAINDLQFQLKGDIQPVVAALSRLSQAIDAYYGFEDRAARVLKDAAPKKIEDQREAAIALDAEQIEGRLKEGGNEPYVDLVSMMILHAVKRDATDLHLEPQTDGLRVRIRIDGMLQDMLKLPSWSARPLVSRIKVIGKLDVAQRREPQDGKVAVSIGGRRVDLRISAIPSQFGENVVLRLLNPEMLSCDLIELGWNETILSKYFKMISKPRGMVLCVGPTGSGKTTTLYSTIHRLLSDTTSIVTIEDPIEYTLDGIVQFEVEHNSRLTFATIIPKLLRQDPDVMVVGEIRDSDTAKAAVQATTTGHLVLSSLHTGQTTSSIMRLLELGTSPQVLSDILNGIVAQRLVRRVCPKCSIVGPPEKEEWKRLDIEPQDLGDKCRRVGPGCADCLFTGYRGRIGVFEVFTPDEELQVLIQAGASEKVLWRTARKNGMDTLLEDALQKVSNGVTTLEEVARMVPVNPWSDKASRDTIDRESRALKAAASKPDEAPAEEEATAGQAVAAEEAPGGEPAPFTTRPTVMVVDDAEEILRLVWATLEDSYELVLASDGEEAMELVTQVMPDLMVLDVMMPKLDGYEVCEKMKANPQTADVPILILSARSEKNYVKEGLRLGADDYLPKPFDPEELELRVKALLRRSGKLPRSE